MSSTESDIRAPIILQWRMNRGAAGPKNRQIRCTGRVLPHAGRVALSHGAYILKQAGAVLIFMFPWPRNALRGGWATWPATS
jgi:hypothetical protein